MADLDNVIKATDICRGNGHCEDCHYYQGHAGYTIMDCRKYMLNDVYTVLQEQQEEIKRLRTQLDEAMLWR